jgi:hypothetical protein
MNLIGSCGLKMRYGRPTVGNETYLVNVDGLGRSKQARPIAVPEIAFIAAKYKAKDEAPVELLSEHLTHVGDKPDGR